MQKSTDLGVQLYSTRNDLGPGLGSTISRLRGYGYTHVEPYDILSDTAALKRALDESGMLAAATHAKITDLDPERLFEAASLLGIGTIVVPWVEPERVSNRESIRTFASEINAAARVAEAKGIRVGYHNHDFEFSTIVDGRPAWELLVDELDSGIILELDTYWASVGGGDVFTLLERYRDRIRYLHVKNEPPDADDPPLKGVDITGRLDEIVAQSRDFVELNVVEIVVDGDVFPYLERNHDFFVSAQQEVRPEP
jgi:sugar phosphate isomerase/epimerase